MFVVRRAKAQLLMGIPLQLVSCPQQRSFQTDDEMALAPGCGVPPAALLSKSREADSG